MTEAQTHDDEWHHQQDELALFGADLRAAIDFLQHVRQRHWDTRRWRLPLRRLAQKLFALAERMSDVAADERIDLGLDPLPPTQPAAK